MTAEDWYRHGNDFRRRGEFHEALNCYVRAVEIDPESPAAVAKEMVERQFEFFCKDYYNP